MTTWCIVAIPEENDRVWKLSSEKVPHMTLLFLGEQDDPEIAREIALQIQHTVSLSMKSFSADVDERGVLGADNADVLFFDKDTLSQRVYDFRTQLLQDPIIRRAYDSTEQFPEWTPHLTLGYPETPAKELKDDWERNLTGVYFNKIGFWIEQDDGPTFDLDYRTKHDKEVAVLKEGRSYNEYGMDDCAPMAMSDSSREFLAHGLPQKRRTFVPIPTPANTQHLRPGSRSRSYIRPVMEVLEESLLHTLETTAEIAGNARYLRHADEDNYLNPEKLQAQDVSEHQMELVKHLKHSIGGRPSETAGLVFDVTTLPNKDWVLSTVDILAHTGTAETRIRPLLDDGGMIESYAVISDNVPQDDLKYVIRHVGVKGMKWGVRRKASELASAAGGAARAKRSSMAESRSMKKEVRGEARAAKKTARADTKAAKKDLRKKEFKEKIKRPVTEDAALATQTRVRTKKHGTDALSNKELQTLVTRMNLEQQLSTLQANDKAAKARNSGRAYLGDLMKEAGKTAANEAASYAASEAMKYAFGRASEASATRRENRASSRVDIVPPRQLTRREQRALPSGR